VNEGNSENDKKYGAHKRKTHTSCKLQVVTSARLMMLTKILEKGNVNMMSLCRKEGKKHGYYLIQEVTK